MRQSLLLVGLAFAVCGAVLVASLRHTGSLAFPIDDGYIYSNYVLAAAQGHLFTYNPGETSGGVTGFGWYLLCTLSYWLLSPLHSLLGGFGPPAVRGDVELSRQAVHLYLAAYLPGALCLAAMGVGAYWLSRLAFVHAAGGERVRDAFCWLAAAVCVADLGLVWGAMSGLEIALSCALAVWAVYLLLRETGAGRLRLSLLLAALLPWARPELAMVAAAGGLWLFLWALLAPGGIDRKAAYYSLFYYVGAAVAGFAVLGQIYHAGWGRALPSSFYAKVGGLRPGRRFFSAAEELWIAGRSLPLGAAAATLVAGLAQVLLPYADREGQDNAVRARWAALLLLLVPLIYTGALMLTLPWFGQEERYLLPIHPFAVILLVGLLWRVAALAPVSASLLPGRAPHVLALGVVILLVGVNYLWATRVYAVEVRNVADGHIAPSRWLAANTPPGTVVAAEPIGAVRLFSERRTVDLVGLTTPATLGTYRDWARAWPALREAGADYLLFYPNWFDGRRPPRWAVEVARFPIPDNRIAGDSLIAAYRLDWSSYRQP